MNKPTKEYIAEFKYWLASIGKSEIVQCAVTDAIKNPNVLTILPETRRKKIEDYIKRFDESRK